MQPTLSALKALFNTLNEQNIQYCHWKSNQHLTEALQGKTDLDLLVARDHEEKFRTILYQHGCKSIISPPGRQYPAIEDYLGYDQETGCCFHLHVHYQLILGERFVKNYRLPLEKQFLESTTLKQGVKIVTSDLELIVLAIRALLKYRDRDAVKDIFSIRSPGLPTNILKEFKYLLQTTSLEEVTDTLASKVKIISSDIVIAILKTITQSPRRGYQLYQLRQRLRQELTPFERHTRSEANKQYFRTLWCQTMPFTCSLLGKKKPASGGTQIALVGADGAGKSTTLKMMEKWLSWKMDVKVFYMGSGQQISGLSKILKFLMNIEGRIQKGFAIILGKRNPISKWVGHLYQLTENYFNLSLAQTRYRRYLESRRQSAQGTIIIYDRYPLNNIHQVMGDTLPPMDGPRIAWNYKDEAMTKFTAILAKTEEQIYQQITPPEHLILLHVTPEVSIQRKPDHHFEQVSTKIQAIEAMDRGGLQITDVDTTQPLEQTLLQIKSALWNIL